MQPRYKFDIKLNGIVIYLFPPCKEKYVKQDIPSEKLYLLTLGKQDYFEIAS